MFFEQHSLEPNLGAAFFWLTLVKGGRDLQSTRSKTGWRSGYQALRRDGEASLEARLSSSPTATPSPTSRSMPTRTSRTNATSTSMRFRRSAPGSTAWSIRIGMCRWTGTRRRKPPNELLGRAGRQDRRRRHLTADVRAADRRGPSRRMPRSHSRVSRSPTLRGFATSFAASAKTGSGSRGFACRTPSSPRSFTIERSRCTC